MKPLIALCLLVCSISVVASDFPWSVEKKCQLARYQPEGVLPDAFTALQKLKVEHRITRALDLKSEKSNYHGPDLHIDGKAYTAAVDISIRCLSSDQIKQLLGALADTGFTAWYRKGGADGWPKEEPDHIHAVWVHIQLKTQLKKQVDSWLNGRTGLKKNEEYKFWQPTDIQRCKVRWAFESSKKLLK